MSRPVIDLRGVWKVFSGPVVAVHHVALSVNRGEFLSFLGPSGCGKTTTLRMIAGFVTPTAGEISLEGRNITRLAPRDRNVGMVFQQYALFPHLTVFENVAFGLHVRRVPNATVKRRVADYLSLVQLPGYEARYPSSCQRASSSASLWHVPSLLNPRCYCSMNRWERGPQAARRDAARAQGNAAPGGHH